MGKTLEDFLRRDAALYPDKVAVICAHERYTYRQLWDKVASRAQSLAHCPPSYSCTSPSGRHIIPFLASSTIDFLVEYFAIHLSNAVAVPLKVPMDIIVDAIPDDIADILFTTGTTGNSKGVMISHSTIIANAENLIEAQGYHHALTFIINGPLNHIGSLSKIYPIILVGGTLHIIDGMKDLNAFFMAMDKAPSSTQASAQFATFLVPASIRMLLTFAAERLASYKDKIEFIETGAAPIAQSDMEKLCTILPNSRLYNTYASTETGIIATYDFNHEACLARCLGKPMKHSKLFITEEGKVACSGKTLMSGYYHDKILTDEVLHDGVLYTSDMGTIDANGRLHLQGRDGDVINVGGYKVNPSEVEDAALALPYIKDCICIPTQHKVLGTLLKLLVVLKEGFPLNKRKIALGLKEKLPTYKIPTQYEQVDAIRHTFNGKIDRKAYRET